MRGVVGALVVLATAAVGVPRRRRGRTTSCRCGAPGAGGINRAWQRRGAFTYRTDIPPDPSSYDIADQCRSQLLVATAPTARQRCIPDRSGNWIFDAPAGTRITAPGDLAVRRQPPHGRRTTTDGRHVAGLRARRGRALIGGVFGETCTAAPGSIGCSFGSDTGVSDASHAVYPTQRAKVSYTISCEYTGGCPRYYDDGTTRPIATIKIFGTRVTVNDPTAPSLKVGGPFSNPAGTRPARRVTYDASDSSGIRAVRLDLAGRSRAATQSPATTT